MKVIFYQTEQPFPSHNLYKWMGGDSRKVFFSNTQDFNQGSIEAQLPFNLTETSLFLVPQLWKEAFLELLRTRFPRASWEQQELPQELPQQQEMGEGQLTTFYGQIEITECWKGAEPQAQRPLKKTSVEKSITISDTFFPIAIFIVILLLLMMFLKPSVLDIYRSQMPAMLKKADQSLEKNIEETSYWAQDRILKIGNDYRNSLREKDDIANIKNAEALVEAVKEVDAAISGMKLNPPISQLEQRKSATQKVKAEAPESYTLQIARMSSNALEKWLEELTEDIRSVVFVDERGEQWTITYGQFTKKTEKLHQRSKKFSPEKGTPLDQLPKAILEQCCTFQKFEGKMKRMMGEFLRFFPKNFPRKIAEEKKIELMELINYMDAYQIPEGKDGLYIPKHPEVSPCLFSQLKECGD